MERYFKDMDYEKISEEEAFNGKRVRVKIEKYYNKRDNKELYREHIKAGNGAVIMPFLDDNTLVMIQEIRTPIGKSILAFPAGLIEKGEDPETAAKNIIIKCLDLLFALTYLSFLYKPCVFHTDEFSVSYHYMVKYGYP